MADTRSEEVEERCEICGALRRRTTYIVYSGHGVSYRDDNPRVEFFECAPAFHKEREIDGKLRKLAAEKAAAEESEARARREAEAASQARWEEALSHVEGLREASRGTYQDWDGNWRNNEVDHDDANCELCQYYEANRRRSFIERLFG